MIVAVQKASPAPELISINDATRLLGLGRTSIYKLCRTGNLELVHIGRRAMITMASVEKFLQGLKEKSHA